MLQYQWNECYQIVTSNMEFHSDCHEELNDQKTNKVNICLSHEVKQSKKLGSILNFERYKRTYDDSCPQVLKNAQKSKGFHQKQHVERMLPKSEELVMYMSCLPSYLERGEKPQEKPFNIGVLDWRLLEKWQHNNNDVGINSEHSPSTSNTTFISSRASSSHCSSDNTRSCHQQKIKYPLTRTEVCSDGTKLLAGNRGEILDCKNGSINPLKVQQSLSKPAQSSSLDTVNRLINSKCEGRELQKVAGRRLQPFGTNGIVSGSKGNGMIYKGAEEQVPSSAVNDCEFFERRKTAMPESRNDPGSEPFPVGHQSDSSKGDKNRLLEENGYTFYGGSSAKVCHTKLRSDYTHFYSVANIHGKTKDSQVANIHDKTKDSQVEKSFSKETRNLNCPFSNEQTIPLTESASISPSRRKNMEKNSSGSKPRNVAENGNIQMKVDISESSKVRNPSPTRRFSFGVSRIGKKSNTNSSDKANLVIPDPTVTSTSACLNDSTTEKSNAAGRARSSPLRRLLDSILKPRGMDSHVAKSSQSNPSTKDRTSKLSSKQIEPPALCSVKGTLDLNGFITDDIGGQHHPQKNGTSSMQALLQVAVKNGLPLFTFTVGSCPDVLAATVKELSSNKTMCRWVYTFFSFSEMKKNNGHWINQGSKDRNHGYISNIIAQMKVSDIPYTDSTGKKYVSNSSRREFILSSVGTSDIDQTSDPLPGNELAAIVVKFPERIGGQLNQDGHQRGTYDKQSVTGLQESFPKVRKYSNSGDGEGNDSASNDLFSTTVILPGGHHGVPSKGEPSPLIERWKSGGLCDCGGWDLGCRLRILSDSNQRFKSAKSRLTAFKLFSQEEVEEERPTFVLSPFEDGIFSVEFNSSLKLIQAFSIGIAVLHSRTSAILSSNMSDGKMSEEITVSENSMSKIFNQAQFEVSAKYFANPPLSPVGRV